MDFKCEIETKCQINLLNLKNHFVHLAVLQILRFVPSSHRRR